MPKKRKNKRNWSKYVTQHSFALQLEKGVFTWDNPKKIVKKVAKVKPL